MIDRTGKHSVIVSHRHGNTKITLIGYPDKEDWMEVKRRALISIGKHPKTYPSSEWIARMLDARHSPIRYAMYSFEYEDIPSNTSTHFARHVHSQPYISTLRPDRTPPEYIKNAIDDLTKAVDGDLAARCTPVSMILDANAESIQILANKRLCTTASEITRIIMSGMAELVVDVTPEMKNRMVPMCVHCGGICHEFDSCGRFPHAAL